MSEISVPISPAPAPAPVGRQIVLTAVIAVLLAGGLFAVSRSGHGETKTPTAPAADPHTVAVDKTGAGQIGLQTAVVQTVAPSQALRLTGTVGFPSDASEKVSPRLSGRVRTVRAKVGDYVQAGQTLATMDSVDAATAQTTLRQNENKLALTRANAERQHRLLALGTPDVTAARAALEQARQHAAATKDTLARVREQEKIGGFTDQPLSDAQNSAAQAASDLAQSEADLAQAQSDRDRTAKLVEIGVSAKRDLETAETTLDKSKTVVSTNRERVTLTKQTLAREQKAFQSRLYANNAVRTAESDFNQAQLQEQAAGRALRLSEAAIRTNVEQAESDLRAAGADAANARIAANLLGATNADGTVSVTAPISGMVSDRAVNPGQVVDQSQETPWQMFTIVSPQFVQVDANVYDRDAAKIHPGLPVTVTADALPGVAARGVVSYVAPTLDPKTHTLLVRTRLPNTGGRWRDGMFATVTIDAGRAAAKPEPVIALSAVQHDGDADFVWRKTANGTFARTAVTLGETLPAAGKELERVVITKGLRGGETVVTQGGLFLTGGGNGG